MRVVQEPKLALSEETIKEAIDSDPGTGFMETVTGSPLLVTIMAVAAAGVLFAFKYF